jgi:hypothetical protein
LREENNVFTAGFTVARKVKRSAKSQSEGDLFITIENEDWVAVYGTRAELARLGQAILDLANAEGPVENFILQDGDPPMFRRGSLGYIVYRRPSGWPDAV